MNAVSRRLVVVFCLSSGLASAGAPDSVPKGERAKLNVFDEARAQAAGYRRQGPVPEPKDNPSTPAKIALGKMLFFDPRLSASQIVSCATCHNPSLSWGDGLPRAVGHGMKTLGRRTPTILNAGFGGPFMWDGRFETLEDQALGPITSPAEMNMPADDVVARLRGVEAYVTAFEKTFPGEGIKPVTIARAIAAYERTVVSPPAPFDRFVAGDRSAISQRAQRGFLVFNGKAGCANCHSGWRFTDDSFHDIGVSDADVGRGALKDFTELTPLQHAFKTPSLRDVERRAPFLHDGSATSLEAVIDFYDRGGDAKRESLSSDVKPLGLSAQEKADLLEFLKTLSSPVDVAVPVLPR
ncbi:MAG: cytochrome c peroxidase [Archangium sp.]